MCWEIIIISPSSAESIAQKLEESIKLPTKSVNIGAVMDTAEAKELDYLPSYGASILLPGDPESMFDLASEELKAKSKKIRSTYFLIDTSDLIFLLQQKILF